MSFHRRARWIGPAAAAVGAAVAPLAATEPSSAPARSLPYAVGERLDYQVAFGGLSGGTAVQTVEGLDTVSGRTAHRVVFEAKTNKTFDLFHRTRDRHVSWIDAERVESLRFVESAREGSYVKDTETVIDPERGWLEHVYKTSKHEGRTSTAVPPGAQDPVSILYFLRTLPLAPGARFEIPTLSGGEVYRTALTVKGIAKVRVPAGVFTCYHVVPSLEETERRKGQAEVWVSTGPERWPVLVKTKLAFGSFTARLVRFSAAPPTNPQ